MKLIMIKKEFHYRFFIFSEFVLLEPTNTILTYETIKKNDHENFLFGENSPKAINKGIDIYHSIDSVNVDKEKQRNILFNN